MLYDRSGFVSHSGVAVVIAAKDAAGTIQRAVASALAEPEASEVVVVDDGSTDETAALASACDDGSGRLTVISQANSGPAAARNRAIALSTAPLICVLDADDYFLPGRLAALLQRAGTDWDLAADELLVANGDQCAPSALARSGNKVAFHEFVRGNISDPRRPRGEMGFLKPLMRRAFLERHGLGYDESLRLGEDYALYAEALAHGARFVMVDACGYVSVVRPGSLSHKHSVEDLAALIAADERLACLPGLSRTDVEIVGRHRRMLRLKWSHRRALQAKSAGRLLEALRVVFQDPRTALYILHQTLEAKREALAAARRDPGGTGWPVAEVAPVRRPADAA